MERPKSGGAPENLPTGERTEKAIRLHELYNERRELRDEFKQVVGKSWNKAKKSEGEGEVSTEAGDLDALQRAIEQGTIASILVKEKISHTTERATQLSESLRELDEEVRGFGTEHIPGVRAEAKFESKYNEVSGELAKLENLRDEMDRQEFELLRHRRGNLNVADRKLLAQFQSVKNSIAAREMRVRTDVETAPAARLHELNTYRRELLKGHFAETPSRTKYENEIRVLMEENKSILLTGPTGTGKTEMVKHLTNKLYERDPEIIRSSERTGPAEIFGKIGLQISGVDKDKVTEANRQISEMLSDWVSSNPAASEHEVEMANDRFTHLVAQSLGAGTTTYVKRGPFIRAADEGVPLLIDEIDALDPKVRIEFKEYYNWRPGKKAKFQQDGEIPFEYKNGFAIVGTANLATEKYKDARFKFGPEESRVFEMRRIEFLPKDELYDLALATLMDSQGRIRLSQTDATERLKHLVEAAEMIQGAFLGAGTFYEEGGGGTKKPWVLEKAVLDPGKVLSMLSGWPAAEARGETFGTYLDQQLISFTNKEDFPEKDRNLLIKIFLTKGFFAGREAGEFLTSLKPDKLRTWGLKERREPEERMEVPLRARDVALLDPFEKRKLELAKIGNEFLDEQFDKVPYKEDGKTYKPGALLKRDGRVYQYVGLNAEGKPVLAPFETKKTKTESREEFTALVEREASNLQKFFGKDIDVPPVPASITPEQHEKWKEMKFELHYLPAENMSDSENYPGWKKKPGAKYSNGSGIEFLAEAQNSQNDLTPDVLQLTGAWVLVDTRDKPAYQSGDQNYKDDKFAEVIEELRKASVIGEKRKKGSRFHITWEELQKPEVKAKLAEILEVSPGQIRLPRAVEWNFLGNAYYQQWGNTNTWEWFEEVYKSSRHLIGGDSDGGGLSNVYWDYVGKRYDNIGFRPLIVFS